MSIVHTPTVSHRLNRKLELEFDSAKRLRKRPRIQRGPHDGQLFQCDKDVCDRYGHILTKEYILGINVTMDNAHQYAIDNNLLPDKNYFEKVQTQIKPWMRRLMFLELTQVHLQASRMNVRHSDYPLWQTFFLLDRYFSVVDVRREDLPLIAHSAYSIACKLHDESGRGRKVAFTRICTQHKLAEMERCIVITLDWEFTLPNCYDFLERFTRIAVHPVKEERYRTRIKYLALYAMERVNLGERILRYTPRCIASACIYTALTCSARKFRWSRFMVSATGYEENCEELLGLVEHIRTVIFSFDNEEHEVVIRKYAVPERGAVSTLRVTG